jgi:hypothetical protein
MKKLDGSKNIEEMTTSFLVESLQKKVQELEAKNRELQNMVNVLLESQKNNFSRSSESIEEAICETEIDRMKQRIDSSDSELTLDDVKKLETLFKVKKSAREYQQKVSSNRKSLSLPKDITEVDVKQLASLEVETDSESDDEG